MVQPVDQVRRIDEGSVAASLLGGPSHAREQVAPKCWRIVDLRVRF